MSYKKGEAEFDRYAKDYGKLHARSIHASGEEPAYFARYKIAEMARVSQGAKSSNDALRILDFGCGIGGSIPDLVEFFPAAEIAGTDVSSESLAIARESSSERVEFSDYDGERLPYPDAYFDIVFTCCVFHHIAPEMRPAALREIRRVLKPGGEFFFFEHNPWNPLTAKAVKDCPFDKDAILLASPEAKGLLAAAGFALPRLSYVVFFPHALSFLRPLEKHLRAIPLGAQYYLHAAA